MRNPKNQTRNKSLKGIPSKSEGMDGDLSLRTTLKGIGLFGKVGNSWYRIGTAEEITRAKKLKTSDSIHKSSLLKSNQTVKQSDKTIKIGNSRLTVNDSSDFFSNQDTDYLHISSSVFGVTSNNTTSKIRIGDISLQPTWGTVGSTLKLENLDNAAASHLKILGSGSTAGNNSGGNTILSSGAKTPGGSGSNGSITLGAGDSGTSAATALNVNATSTVLSGTLTINTINTDTAGDNYLVEVSNVVKKRTPGEVLADIGGAAAASIPTNYITNDAADIMAVSDFGANAALKIDADQPATAGAEDSKGLWIDYDRIVAGSGTANHHDIGIDLDVNTASLGTSSVKGIDIDVVGATSGTHTAYGITVNVSGSDSNLGILSNVTNGGIDFKCLSSANIGDFFTINTTTNGATTLATTDADATSAHLTLDADGDIILDAGDFGPSDGIQFLADGTKIADFTAHHTYSELRLYENEGASTDDFVYLQSHENGVGILGTLDAAGTAAHLILDPDGELNLTPATEVKSDAPLKIKEAADAVADTAAYGQLWVKTATPNELYFTTDAGDDIQITTGTGTAGGGGTSRWSFTFGGYGPSNSSSTNYYTSSYGGSYYYWSASDSSPTTVAYNRRPFWTAPADGTITRITINLHSTSALDDIKFYVFKGAFADDEYTTDITLLATSDASGLDTANRNFTIDTTFSSSNDFTAGQQLWVFFKKETNNATMRHYFSGTVSGEFD